MFRITKLFNLGLMGLGALVATAPGEARADVDSMFTLGVGAQYSYVAPDVGSQDGAPERMFGLVTRLKVLHFLGAEAGTNFDQDPGTQQNRILSPRYQVGAMLNLLPLEHFNLFAVGGTGAQRGGDLFDLEGKSTSFHFGPGLEVFVGDHVAVGGDVRWRMPGPGAVKEEVEARLATEALSRTGSADEPATLEIDAGPRVWQANFTVSFYL
jgi:hypothetical protein